MSNAATGAIVCIGDISVDLVAKVDRLPTTDGKVNGSDVTALPGGMAANVAVTLARLGAPAAVLGVVGDDGHGASALAAMRDAGVDTSRVAVMPDAATFTCVTLVEPSGEKSLIRLLGPAYLPGPDRIADGALEGVGHVHFTFGCRRLAERIVAACEARGATMSLDLEAADVPDGVDGLEALRSTLAAVDIVFVNRASRRMAEAALGPLAPREGQRLVTTLGAEGARIEREGLPPCERPGRRVAAVDTSGAGDAFVGAFLLATHRDLDDPAMLAFANAAASLSVRAHGAQGGLPTMEEVEAVVRVGPAGTAEGTG